MKYEKHLSEPWFSLVKLKIKTVEGRLNKGIFINLKVGDIIEFYNDDIIERRFRVKITKINTYNTFEDYLKKETLKKCLPGYMKIKDGLQVYYKYYSKEDEEKYNVKCFTMNLI